MVSAPTKFVADPLLERGQKIQPGTSGTSDPQSATPSKSLDNKTNDKLRIMTRRKKVEVLAGKSDGEKSLTV